MSSIEHDARDRELVDDILARTRELVARRLERQRFEAGRTPVRYAGRVYDAAEVTNLVRSCLEFWLTAGSWHHRLERALSDWYGVANARLVNSGSSANLVAVAALTSPKLGTRRLRSGDEVITIAAGFPTTVAPLFQAGLVPVFVDVTLPTANVDVTQLEEALSPRTRAVIFAHTLGNPFDLDAVRAFCRERDLWLIEDNCDAAGARYDGRKTGTFGDLATLSFYPAHQMTTGEGGAVLCSTEELGKLVASFRDWGRDCWCNAGVDNTCRKRFRQRHGELPERYDHKYVYSHLGFNVKMTDLQASVGLAQLEKLDGFVAARRDNFLWFREKLGRFAEFFILPEATPASEPSWFGFLLTVREGAPFTRDDVVRHLEGQRIQTRMLFGGNLTRQPALVALRDDRCESKMAAPFRTVGPLPNTDRIMTDSLWFGVYPGITPPMRSYIAEQIESFLAGRGLLR